jgi:hypothetical protein
MNISPIIFFDLVAAILILAVAFIIVIFYLAKITRFLNASPEIRDNAYSLDTARTKAIKIIDDANKQALDIVNKITLSSDVASESFKQEIMRVSSAQLEEFEQRTSEFTKAYLQVLQDLKTKNIEVFQNVSKDIETNTMAELQNFKQSMQNLTIFSEKEVKKKVDIDYETVRKEIENYKKEEFARINSRIYEFLETTAKLILGKALSISDHEDLIKKSLEKAQKEGVFK